VLPLEIKCMGFHDLEICTEIINNTKSFLEYQKFHWFSWSSLQLPVLHVCLCTNWEFWTLSNASVPSLNSKLYHEFELCCICPSPWISKLQSPQIHHEISVTNLREKISSDRVELLRSNYGVQRTLSKELWLLLISVTNLLEKRIHKMH
jgi:hypothetical protein